MPKKIDLAKLKSRSNDNIAWALQRIDDAAAKNDYLVIRWMSAMTAVELHGIWERYTEARLVAALNHDARYFVAAEGISGVTHISSGLASFIIRGGSKYFDFRSMSELIGKADKWLGPSANPFRALTPADRKYIDVLAAIRNCVVHGSDAAKNSYSFHLKQTYGISYAPLPEEFLHAKDNRAGSPKRYHSRLQGLAVVMERAIKQS